MSSTNSTVRRGVRGLLRVACTAALLLTASVRADDEPADREIKSAEARIHALVEEAAQLRERGRSEAARALMSEAEALQQRLRLHLERRGIEERHHHLTVVLEHLEHGMVALRELERIDALHMLEEIAGELRAEIRELETLHERVGREPERERDGAKPERGERDGPRRTEREIVASEIEVMRLAVHALLEAERADSAEIVERAIRAREVALEGRRDEEAARIRENAPELAQQVELMAYASELWAEFGHERKAQMVGELAAQLRERFQRRSDRRAARQVPERDHVEAERLERDRRAGDRELQVARRQLEQMHFALDAFREAGLHDAIEAMARAIRAREVNLERRDDEEARMIRERAPGLGQQVELLQRAAGLLRGWGAAEKAQALNELAEQTARKVSRQGGGEREREARDVERPYRGDRIERLERRIEELQAQIAELSRTLRETK